MPISDQEDVLNSLNPKEAQEQDITPHLATPQQQAPIQDDPNANPSTGQIFKSAFELSSPTASLIANGGKIDNRSAVNQFAQLLAPASGAMLGSNTPTNYNFYNDIKNTQYEPYFKDFIGSQNPEDTQARKDSIDRDLQNRDIMAHSGLTGIAASLSAQILDPTSLIMGMGAYKAAATVGEAVGAGIAGYAARGATMFGIYTAQQEAALQGTQINRTGAESATNIASSAVFGGLVGPAAGAGGLAAGMGAGAAVSGVAALASGNQTAAEIAGNAIIGGIMGGALHMMPSLELKQSGTMASNVIATGDIGKVVVTPKESIKSLEPIPAPEVLPKPIILDASGKPKPEEPLNEEDTYSALANQKAKISSNLQEQAEATGTVPLKGEDVINQILNDGKPGEMEMSDEGMPTRPDAQTFLTGDVKMDADKFADEQNAVYGPRGEEDDSVGAARVHGLLFDAQIRGLDGRLINLTQVPIMKNPVIEGLTSSSPFLRQMTSRLFETSLELKSNVVDTAKGIAGRPTPIAFETLMKEDKNEESLFQSQIQDIYYKYVGVGEGPMRGTRAALEAKRSDKLTYGQFQQSVANAAAHGDQSLIPEVAKAAELGRKRLNAFQQKLEDNEIPSKEFWQELRGEKDTEARLEAAKDKLEKLSGQRPLDPNESMLSVYLRDENKTGQPDFSRGKDESYFPKLYDKNKIMDNRNIFEKRVSDWLETQGVDHIDAIDRAQRHADNILGFGDKDMKNQDLTDFAKDELNPTSIFFKGRTSDIPRSVLNGFLIDDYSKVMQQYMSSANRMIRTKQFYQSMGMDKYSDIVNALQDEHNYNISRDSENSKYYDQEFRKNLKLSHDFVSMAMGTFKEHSQWDSSLRALKTYNNVRLMGQFVLTAITHLSGIVLRFGPARTLVDGILKTGMNAATGLGKLSKEDLTHFDTAIDSSLNDTIKSIIDPEFNNIYDQKSKAENAMDATNKVFGVISGINKFISKQKEVVGNMQMSRIIGDLKQYDTLSDKEKTYLNSMHIGADDVPKIMDQFNKYGATKNGGNIANLHLWNDEQAKDTLFAAVRKEMDTAVPTAGMGDIPRWVQQKEIYDVMFQYKKFFSAVSSRILLSGMQHHDAAAVAAIFTFIGLGQLSYIGKTYLAGEIPDFSLSNLLQQGLTRSGMLGLMQEPIFGAFLSPWIHGNNNDYNNASPLKDFIIGPSGGLIDDSYKAYKNVTSGQMDDKTLKSLEQLLPYQNVTYLRPLLNKLNKEVPQRNKGYKSHHKQD